MSSEVQQTSLSHSFAPDRGLVHPQRDQRLRRLGDGAAGSRLGDEVREPIDAFDAAGRASRRRAAAQERRRGSWPTPGCVPELVALTVAVDDEAEGAGIPQPATNPADVRVEGAKAAATSAS